MVAQQNADIADTLQLRDVAMANIFGFLLDAVHIGATRRKIIKAKNYPSAQGVPTARRPEAIASLIRLT